VVNVDAVSEAVNFEPLTPPEDQRHSLKFAGCVNHGAAFAPAASGQGPWGAQPRGVLSHVARQVGWCDEQDCAV
jgi:hypothetical protein